MNKFSYFILIMQRASIRNYKKTIGLFILLTIVLSFGIPRLQFLLSIDDLIDSDFQSYTGLNTINTEFNDKNSILLSIETNSSFKKKDVCDIQKWILKVAKSEKEILKIQSSFGLRQAVIENQILSLNSFLEVNCLSDLDEIEKLKQGFRIIQDSPWKGLLSTLNNESITINFIIKIPESKTYGSINADVVDRLKINFDENFKNSEFNFFWAGVTTYQNHLKKAMDLTQLLNGLMFLISLFIFRYFLGSWKAGLIFNTTVVFCLFWTYGLMGYVNVPIDVLTNATGLMLFVSCLEDFVFVCYGMKKFNWSLSQSIRKFTIPAFFTSLTTSIGFASLITSDLAVIRRVGLIVAFAGMLEWFLVFIVLPALLKSKWQNHFNFKFNAKIISIPRFDFKPWPKSITYFIIAAVTIPLFFWQTLKVKDSPEDFFFQNHEVNVISRHLLKTRGWINESSLVFTDGTSDVIMKDIIQQVSKNPLVFNVENIFDTKKFLTEKLQDDQKKSIENIWQDSMFSRRFISESNTVRAQVFLNSMDTNLIRNFMVDIENICQKNCQIVGTLISYNEFGDRVLRTLIESLAVSLILVILILVLVRSHLSIREIIPCIISSIWGPLALFSIFIYFQIPIFFVSSICASILVGIAGDNAIQFIFFSKKKNLSNSINTLTEASQIVTIGTCLMLTVFFLSPVAPLSKLGFFMILGILLTYIGDIWILKGLLRKK